MATLFAFALQENVSSSNKVVFSESLALDGSTICATVGFY